MSNNKYQFKGTPGPWKHFFNTPNNVLANDIPESETLPAFKSKSIYVGGDKIVCTVDAMDIGNFTALEHFEANAHLIAAAPDLLEACKEAYKIFDYMNIHCMGDKEKRVYESMQAAIHKALNIEAEEA